MQKMILILLAYFCFLLSGCALFQFSSPSANYDGLSSKYQADSQALAKQSAIELAKVYPSGQTVLTLKNDSSYFAQALEHALRQQGFAVSEEGTEINYVLDEIQGETEPTAYLQIKTPKQTFGYVRVLNKNLAPPMENTSPVAEIVPLQAPKTVESAIAVPITESKPINENNSDWQAMLEPVVTDVPVPSPSTNSSMDIKLRPVPLNEWSIAPGSLQAQLYSWASRADYSLIWKANLDYEIENFANFQGDFVTAISQLFNALHKNGYLLRAAIYEQNKVLAVMEN